MLLRPLRRLPSQLVNWLFPDSCASCEAPLAHASDLFCEGCAAGARLVMMRRQLRSCPVWSCSAYAGPVSAALQRFKFQGHPELARRLARTLHRHAAIHLPPHTTLVPVPLHPLRLAERGYNQSALLARQLAKLGNWACLPRALERTEATQRQTELGRAERWQNVRGKFRARSPLGGRDVLLVDDVLTTGATIESCAAALQAAGARVVGALTFAQAP